MNAKLNVRIDSELKYLLKNKCEQDGIPLEVVVTNLLADFVGEDRFKINFEREHPVLLPPMEPIEGWCPEIDYISFSVVDRWLGKHLDQDTSVAEVWFQCFGVLNRKPRVKEIKMIGAYLQRSGWCKTMKVNSSYRVNKTYGRSHVFVKVDQEPSLSVADLLV